MLIVVSSRFSTSSHSHLIVCFCRGHFLCATLFSDIFGNLRSDERLKNMKANNACYPNSFWMCQYCAMLYDIFIAVSACLITAFALLNMGRDKRNVCNERLIFISINFIKYPVAQVSIKFMCVNIFYDDKRANFLKVVCVFISSRRASNLWLVR